MGANGMISAFIEKYRFRIMKIASDCMHAYNCGHTIDEEDLYSIGCISIMEVVNKYYNMETFPPKREGQPDNHWHHGNTRLNGIPVHGHPSSSVVWDRVIKTAIAQNIARHAKREFEKSKRMLRGREAQISIARRLDHRNADPSQVAEVMDTIEEVLEYVSRDARRLFGEMGSPSKAVMDAYNAWAVDGRKRGGCPGGSIPLKCYARGMSISYKRAMLALQELRVTVSSVNHPEYL